MTPGSTPARVGGLAVPGPYRLYVLIGGTSRDAANWMTTRGLPAAAAIHIGQNGHLSRIRAMTGRLVAIITLDPDTLLARRPAVERLRIRGAVDLDPTWRLVAPL